MLRLSRRRRAFRHIRQDAGHAPSAPDRRVEGDEIAQGPRRSKSRHLIRRSSRRSHAAIRSAQLVGQFEQVDLVLRRWSHLYAGKRRTAHADTARQSKKRLSPHFHRGNMRDSTRGGTASRSGSQKKMDRAIDRQAGAIALDALDQPIELPFAQRSVGKARHGAFRLRKLPLAKRPQHLKSSSVAEANPHRLHGSLLVRPKLRGSCRRGTGKRGLGLPYGLLREAKSACTGSMRRRFYHASRTRALDSSLNVAHARASRLARQGRASATRRNERAYRRPGARPSSKRNIRGRIEHSAGRPARRGRRNPCDRKNAGRPRIASLMRGRNDAGAGRSSGSGSANKRALRTRVVSGRSPETILQRPIRRSRRLRASRSRPRRRRWRGPSARRR